MKNMPIVSIIIPFYSGAQWLQEAIDSVLNQTFKNYEIIVINDGSKENIECIVNKYGNKIKIINKKNEGPAAARNEGINNANGEYIAFLDSDDIWDENKLKHQILAMQEENAVWSQTMLEYFGENIKNKIVDTTIYNGTVFPLCLTSFRVQTSSIVVKRDILLKENIIFPKDKRYGQDTYVWLELAKRYPILAINQPYTKFRIRENNAGFRAHIQLLARVNMWNDIKNDRTSVKVQEIPLILRLNYEFCIASNSILDFLKKIGIKKEKNLELISKFLYLPNWIIFKLIGKTYLKDKGMN